MNIDPALIEQLALRITVALGHLLWQGLAIALIASALAYAAKKQPASWRYAIHLTALLIMAACLPLNIALAPTPQIATAPLTAPLANSFTTASTTTAPASTSTQAPSANPNSATLKSANTSPSGFAPSIDSTHRATPASSSHLALSNKPAAQPAAFLAAHVYRAIAPWITALYAIGLIIMFTRLVTSILAGQTLRRHSTPVDHSEILLALAQQAKKLGLRATPPIAYCAAVTTPAIVGVLRPLILLPFTIATDMTPEQINAILTHELAHLKRYDPIALFAQRLCEAALFFHPAAWFLGRHINLEREQACDDIALTAGPSPSLYATALLAASQIQSPASTSNPALAATGNGPSQLSRRITRVLAHQPVAPLLLTRPVALGFAITLIAIGCQLSTVDKNTAPQPPDLATFAKDVKLTSMRRSTFTGGAFISYKNQTLVDNASADKPGVFMVAVKDGEALGAAQYFRTQALKPEVEKFVDAINELDQDTYVIIAVSCSAEAVKAKAPHVNQAMQDALLSLGAGEGLLGKDRALSYYLIGRKGLAVGLAYEQISKEQLLFPEQTIEERGAGAPTLPFAVIDKATNLPLPNVALHVETDRDIFNVTTNESGLYNLPLFSATKKWIVVTARLDGYAPMYMRWRNYDKPNTLPESFILKLHKAATIGGLIQNENGEPIQGAYVSIHISERGDNETRFTGNSPDARTDENGRWFSENVPVTLQHVSLKFTHPDYPGSRLHGEIPAPPMKSLMDQTALTILRSGMSFTGSVKDDQGNPLTNAKVTLGSDRWSVSYPTTQTDTSGNYTFKSLEAGTALLTVEAKNYAPFSEQISIHPDQKTHEAVLEPGHVITARILDADSKPIEGARVYVDAYAMRTVKFSATTDDDGRFTWTGAPAEGVTFSIRKEGYMDARNININIDDPNATVTLTAPMQLTAHVLDDATGQPIQSFKVTMDVVITPPGDRPVRWDDRNAKTAHNGLYTETFTASMAGRPLKFSAEGYTAVQTEPLKGDGSDAPQIEIRLKPDAGVVGKILNADGTPAVNTRVALATPGQRLTTNAGILKPSVNNQAEMGFTDDQGAFRLRTPNTNYRVIALGDGGYAELDVAQGAQPEPITLAPWGRIEGVVRLGDKTAVSARMSASAHYPGSLSPEAINISFLYSATTDQNGAFTFDRLLPGVVSVGTQLKLPGQMYTMGRSKSVQVDPGQTVNLTLGGTGRPVTGRLTFSDNLQSGDIQIQVTLQTDRNKQIPYPKEYADKSAGERNTWYFEWRKSEEGKAFEAESRLKKFHHSIMMQTDGSFHFDDVPAGAYTLRIRLQPYSRSREMMDIRNSIGQFSHAFEIPPMPGEGIDDPLDLGALEIKIRTRPTETERESVKTLSGEVFDQEATLHKLRLFHYWATEAPETLKAFAALQAVHEKFGDNENLVLLGMNVNLDPEAARRYVEENEIEWTQLAMGAKLSASQQAEILSSLQEKIALMWHRPGGSRLPDRVEAEALLETVEKALGEGSGK